MARETALPTSVAVGLAFLVYLIPLHDTRLAPAPGGPVDRARGVPLARYLEADHELTTARSGMPTAPVVAGEPGRPPVLDVAGSDARLIANEARAILPRHSVRPDASRSPPVL